MNRRYVTADVFTDEKFKGNPVAVVLDAEGLSTSQMQAITVEFGYSETTFVLPPRDPANTAWVRIFTPSREIPFAGHPNIGTAFVLAARAASGQTPLRDQLVFEEAAGLVPVTQLKEDGKLVGAELIAPEPLVRLSQVPQDRVAACLSWIPPISWSTLTHHRSPRSASHSSLLNLRPGMRSAGVHRTSSLIKACCPLTALCLSTPIHAMQAGTRLTRTAICKPACSRPA